MKKLLRGTGVLNPSTQAAKKLLRAFIEKASKLAGEPDMEDPEARYILGLKGVLIKGLRLSEARMKEYHRRELEEDWNANDNIELAAKGLDVLAWMMKSQYNREIFFNARMLILRDYEKQKAEYERQGGKGAYIDAMILERNIETMHRMASHAQSILDHPVEVTFKNGEYSLKKIEQEV